MYSTYIFRHRTDCYNHAQIQVIGERAKSLVEAELGESLAEYDITESKTTVPFLRTFSDRKYDSGLRLRHHTYVGEQKTHTGQVYCSLYTSNEFVHEAKALYAEMTIKNSKAQDEFYAHHYS